MPGALDAFYDTSLNNSDTLCKLCKTEWAPYQRSLLQKASDTDDEDSAQYDDDDTDLERRDMSPTTTKPPNYEAFNCKADIYNRFYGNKGALACLNEVGDVAVVEIQRLEEHARSLNLNPNDFRIICRNNTPAAYTGFDVDFGCRLSTIIDGEIVVKRNNPKNPGIINALSSLDVYLQYDPDFKMYNIYRGQRDLLFEDSSLGLVSPNSTSLGRMVKNYIELFSNINTCNNHAGVIAGNLILSLTLVVLALFLRR